jgi:transmembrane sensor
MADRQEALARAAEHVRPSWTPEREARVRARAEMRLERAEKRRPLVLALAIVVVALAVFGWTTTRPSLFGRPPEVATAPTPATEPAALVRFEDGSVATALGSDARVAPVDVRAHAVGVRLEAGGARFSVAPNPDRVFRVMARDVTVTVLGTVFTVVLEPTGVRVAVERGRVQVAWPAGERTLAVGESAVVTDTVPPAAAGGPNAEEPSETRRAELPPLPGAHSASSVTMPSWRALAEEGDYSHALARLTADGPSAVRDDPEDLLLAADVARLGGHPDRAIASLERILASHPGDSRAPLAAFTLGRTLLDQLGRPREAAQAFARAQNLDPNGALAQDALAREVESWSRAGDASLARAQAEAYSARYPKGRRLQAVRRLGGLD